MVLCQSYRTIDTNKSSLTPLPLLLPDPRLRAQPVHLPINISDVKNFTIVPPSPSLLDSSLGLDRPRTNWPRLGVSKLAESNQSTRAQSLPKRIQTILQREEHSLRPHWFNYPAVIQSSTSAGYDQYATRLESDSSHQSRISALRASTFTAEHEQYLVCARVYSSLLRPILPLSILTTNSLQSRSRMQDSHIPAPLHLDNVSHRVGGPGPR